MRDYDPLDITRHLNGGLDALGAGATAEIGPRHFRGLPFAIGGDPSACFISLDCDSEPVSVPVGHSAFNVVFAHRLLHSDINEGGPVGIHVADYVFVLENGRRIFVPMETTLAHWADEARAQGGWVINPHFPNPNGEPAALVATGRLDGIEMLRQTREHHMEYYRYLNCGYRLPLVGGTDKMMSNVPVGLYRTYARLPDDQEFNYENWCRSVAAGRTFLSGGPIIHLSVEGRKVGDTLSISGPGSVEAEARDAILSRMRR